MEASNVKRVLILSVVALAGLAAVAMGPIDDGPVGLPALPDPEPSLGRSSVWYCLGAAADADPILAAATPGSARVSFSLPVDGAFIDTISESAAGEQVVTADLGDGRRFHPGPALVEVSATPSAAAFVVAGPQQLGADSCQVASKEWFVAGGSVGNGEILTLRLFNPLLEPAIAGIELVSEFGFEPLSDVASVTVPPRAWEDIPIGVVLGDRSEVSARVSVAEGVVIPGFVSITGEGLAIWPGQALSSVWEFPLAQPAGSEGVLTLWNPGESEATVTIELLETVGALPPVEVAVGAARQERIDLTTLTSREVAVIVRSTTPIAAAVRASGSAGSAAGVGAPRAAARWIVPLLGVHSDLTHRITVVNGGAEAAQIVVRLLGSQEATSLTVDARSLGTVSIDGTGAEVTSDQPVTVGWTATGRSDVALSLATPVGGEPSP